MEPKPPQSIQANSTNIEKRAKIYTGKSKDIYSFDENTYLMEFKDEMRAADGRFFLMPGKAKILTNITATIFEYLSKNNIPNHYINKKSEIGLEIKKAQAIPLECVIRRYAEGSFLKRNPSTTKQTRFDLPVFEIFYKEDSLDDPYVVFDKKTNKLALHQAKAPINDETLINTFNAAEIVPQNCTMSPEEILGKIRTLSIDIFTLLESKFKEKNGILCDLKIEFGFDGQNIILIDSIEPDGWRLWQQQSDNNLDRNDGYETEFSDPVIKSINSKYELAANFVKNCFS